MTEGLTLMVGIALFCFVLSYVAFNLDKQHFFLKLILIVVVLMTTTQMARVAMDYEQSCSVVVANETVNDATNVTSYEYKQHCEDNTNTPLTFFKISTWLTRVFWTYLFFWVIYSIGMPIWRSFVERKKR